MDRYCEDLEGWDRHQTESQKLVGQYKGGGKRRSTVSLHWRGHREAHSQQEERKLKSVMWGRALLLHLTKISSSGQNRVPTSTKEKKSSDFWRELAGKQQFLDELKHIIAHFLFECSCTINPSAHSSQIPQPIVIIESPSVQANETCNRMIYDLLSSYSSSLFCVFFCVFFCFFLFFVLLFSS
jgi:hypothetical protein